MHFRILTFTAAVCLFAVGTARAQAPAFATNLPATKSFFAGIAEFNYLEVSATGAAPLTYQWYKDGGPILGATSLSLQSMLGSRALTLADAGTYSVVVRNEVGSATSVSCVVTITRPLRPPSIAQTVPSSSSPVTTTVGNSVVLAATGTNGYGFPMVYRWLKDGSPITGGTNGVLTLSSIAKSQAGFYTVMVDYAPTVSPSYEAPGPAFQIVVNDAPATNTAPAISQQPLARAELAGATTTFGVLATGTPAPSFQWLKDNVALTGATSTSLTLPNVSLADAGKYAVRATNSAGSITSAAVDLAVLLPLTSRSITVGRETVFAAGAGASFQWQVSTDGGTTWSNLAEGSPYRGTATGNLAVTAADTSLNGRTYRYVATVAAATAISNAARLAVYVATFANPVALASDSSGTLFVADAQRNIIARVDTNGTATTLAGTNGRAGSADGVRGSAEFNQPRGVALASDGSLYITDSGNGTVRKLTSTGVVSTLAGSPGNRGSRDGTGTSALFSSPTGIAVSADGSVFVSDTLNHTIRRISSAGAVTTYAGEAGQAGAANGQGTRARFRGPTGLAADAAGNLYVADTLNHLIRKIAPDGTVSTVAGLEGVTGINDGTTATALFNQPTGLAVDTSGVLIVADSANATVRVIAPNGVVSTIAGLPGVSGFRDGTSVESSLNLPKAVAVDRSSNVYVADEGNSALRKITSNGAVSTVSTSDLVAAPVDPAPTTTTTTSTSPSVAAAGGGSGGGGAPGILVTLGLAALLIFRGQKLRREADAA